MTSPELRLTCLHHSPEELFFYGKNLLKTHDVYVIREGALSKMFLPRMSMKVDHLKGCFFVDKRITKSHLEGNCAYGEGLFCSSMPFHSLSLVGKKQTYNLPGITTAQVVEFMQKFLEINQNLKVARVDLMFSSIVQKSRL